MTRTHQLIALRPTVEKTAMEAADRAESIVTSDEQLSGWVKTYTPLHVDTDHPELTFHRPDDVRLVRAKVPDVLGELQQHMSRWLDLVATIEEANTTARADVVVDDKVVLADVPVTVLMFLNNRLAELERIVRNARMLDSSEKWELDPNEGHYLTRPVVTVSTSKTKQPIVGYEATKEHPANVLWVDKDVPEGRWTSVRHSGALPATRRRELLERIRKLHEGVKLAREQANSKEVANVEVAKTFFDWLFS